MVVDFNHKKMIRIMVVPIDRQESIAVDSTFHTLTGVLNQLHLNKQINRLCLFRDLVFVWNRGGSP